MTCSRIKENVFLYWLFSNISNTKQSIQYYDDSNQVDSSFQTLSNLHQKSTVVDKTIMLKTHYSCQILFKNDTFCKIILQSRICNILGSRVAGVSSLIPELFNSNWLLTPWRLGDWLTYVKQCECWLDFYVLNSVA